MIQVLPPPPPERFRYSCLEDILANTKAQPGPLESHCLIWQGSIYQESGYGQIYYENCSTPVHRVVYGLKHGMKLGPKILVCHECDIRPCINPDHLFTCDHRRISWNHVT